MIINKNNYKDACAWLVQLSVDTNNIEEMILKNYEELELALHHVATIAI